MLTAASREAEFRNSILALANLPDPYGFLSYAGEYLAAIPGDDQVRAVALRMLVDKRLFSVAAEFASACPASSTNRAQMLKMAEQFAARGGDQVDWCETDVPFTANLQALRGRGDSGCKLADQIERAWQEMPPHLTLHQASDANRLVRAARSDGVRIWLPAAQDFVGTTEAIGNPEKLRGGFTAAFLVDGAGIGCLVPRLYAATEKAYLDYSPAIYVVEPNCRALALALRLFDWSDALPDERLILTTGPSAWTEWLELLAGDGELPEPQHLVSLCRWPGDQPSPARDFLARLKELRQERYTQQRRRAEAIYTGRDVGWWARRYAQAAHGDPLRVMCMTSRHTTFLQHSMDDWAEAMKRAGLATEVQMESRGYTTICSESLLGRFAEFQPDLVVVIDHHRGEMPDRFVDNVPYVCWIQDDLPHLHSAEVGRSLGPLDFTIGFGKQRCVSRFGYPEERFMACTLAVNLEKFAPGPAGEEPDGELRCDVVYIGHHSETPADLHARVRSQVENEAAVNLMDAFHEETLPLMQSPRFNGAYDLDELLRQMEAKTGIELADVASRSRLMSVYVRPLADRVLRHSTLEWVADWADATGRVLHLYGRGWEAHPRLGQYARGEARHGRHLGNVVRAATVNLHFGINLSLHQRVLETAVAGGFLMVRHHPWDFYPSWTGILWEFLEKQGMLKPGRLAYGDLPDDFVRAHLQALESTGQQKRGYVEITEEFLDHHDPARACERRGRYAGEVFPCLREVTFDGPQSFAERAEHFLAHDDRRRQVIDHMRSVVLQEFTYDILVARMLSFLRERLGQMAGG